MSANPVRPNCARPHSCSLDVRLDAMARSPLTRELKPEEHLDLDSFVTSWAWSEGDPLMLAGQKVSGSYLVVAGRVRVVRDTIDGREITVDIASPGDIVGPLETNPSYAVDSAWAMETTCALYLPADRLAEVIARHPALAVAIVQMQHTRLAQARDRDVNQSAKTVVQRVATVLLRLDAKLGDLRPDGSSLLQVRLRRDDIAGMAGTTLESTSRAMSQMKKDGLIDSGREWVSIIDAQELERIVDGE